MAVKKSIIGIALFISVGFILPFAVVGQDFHTRTIDIPTDSIQRSILQFDRTLNTYLWYGKLVFARNLGPTYVNLRQDARSRVVRTDLKSVKDEVNLSLDVRSRMTEKWNVRASGRSMISSDNRAIDLSNLYQHQGLLGVEYGFFPPIRFSVLGGYELAAQEGIKDDGFAYLGEITGENVNLEDFISSFLLRSSKSFLDNRSPAGTLVNLTVRREFDEMASNILTVNYADQRREFYMKVDSITQAEHQVDHNLFRRDARELSITNVLEYRLDASSRFVARGGLFNRKIFRGYKYRSYQHAASVPLDVRIQELSFFGSLSFEKKIAEWLNSTVNISYDEREERHGTVDDLTIPREVFERQERSAKKLGNIASRTTFFSNVDIDLTMKDRVKFAGSASILRYDTPDTLNTDDRDELLITIGTQSSHQLNSQLRLSLFADVSLSHLVYLSRFQSANNNWNRVLRLGSKVEYKPVSGVRNVSNAEVLANYTVYDYEEQVRSVRSFSFRQAQWSDSLLVILGRSWNFSFVGNVRIYERGILKWREFKEKPENYFLEQTYWPQVTYQAREGLGISIGYRYFSQDRYRYLLQERIWERGLVASGPTAALIWNSGNDHQVEVRGWRETQSEGKTILRRTSNLNMIVGVRI